MDAKARKVFNGLTKLGGEQEVFDLSIAIKMTEDAVQEHLKSLSEEGLVSCRRGDGGKEFWSVSADQSAPSPDVAKEAASGKKKGKATAAGPDDRFDEFVADPKAAAAPPIPSPAPIPPEPAEFDSFEPEPPKPDVQPSAPADAGFDSAPPKEEKRAKGKADADFEPKPEKEKSAKKKAPAPDSGSFEPKSAKELSAGPDDHFDEFAERVPSKPNLPLPLMAGIAALVLIVILFIVGGGGGKTKKSIKTAVEDVKTEFAGKLDSLGTAMSAEIEKARAENKALRNEINALKAKAANSQDAAAKKAAAAAADKPKSGNKKK